jgi:hypothetical protein
MKRRRRQAPAPEASPAAWPAARALDANWAPKNNPPAMNAFVSLLKKAIVPGSVMAESEIEPAALEAIGRAARLADSEELVAEALRTPQAPLSAALRPAVAQGGPDAVAALLDAGARVAVWELVPERQGDPTLGCRPQELIELIAERDAVEIFDLLLDRRALDASDAQRYARHAVEDAAVCRPRMWERLLDLGADPWTCAHADGRESPLSSWFIRDARAPDAEAKKERDAAFVLACARMSDETEEGRKLLAETACRTWRWRFTSETADALLDAIERQKDPDADNVWAGGPRRTSAAECFAENLILACKHGNALFAPKLLARGGSLAKERLEAWLPANFQPAAYLVALNGGCSFEREALGDFFELTDAMGKDGPSPFAAMGEGWGAEATKAARDQLAAEIERLDLLAAVGRGDKAGQAPARRAPRSL